MIKTNRILIALIMCIAIVTGMAFANGQQEAAMAADGDTLDIVFINDGHVAPYHVAWLGGFEDAIKAYNKEFGGITGHWLSAEGSLEKMIQQAEATINQDPDVMFVNAINTKAFEPLVKKAQDQGIIWIAVHSPMESADYSFTLGDVTNGYNQGLALGAYYNGEANVAIMLGQAGNPSGEARREGILKGLAEYPGVKVIAEQPADWDTVKAQSIAENWYTQFPELDAISGVTDAYLYPSIAIAENRGIEDVTFWGYDGDIPILEEMKAGKVGCDILLSGTREGWAFVQTAYKVTHGMKVDKVIDFYTPPVMTEEVYAMVKANGFPSDIEVYMVDKALEVAEKGYLEFGPDSVK
ncbi:MAG: sugar ABC transporter substrate-binding protein [Spirochaetales bacterium]|uniref:Sugar ABC transporter substrate-binding protein n=1 Tax=Candidatus Thalassospirochaeta sargassi TaxID=3119039 RepID=A0AAJ1IDH2_9SPIO|nr:sugar ABC transporter substrate-binding protein [Spirochaetales bacterium]